MFDMFCERDAVGLAITKCPFLKAVADQEGVAYARNFVANPLRSAQGPCVRKPILEEESSFLDTFRLFHGPQGVLPLPSMSPRLAASARQETATEQQQQQQRDLCPASFSASVSSQPPSDRGLPARMSRLPLASMSLPFFGNTPDWGKMFNLGRKPPNRPPPPSSSSASSSSRPGNLRGSGSGRPPHGRPPKVRGPGIRAGAMTVNGAVGGTTPSPAGGGCPLRKALGPFAPLIFNSRGHIACPEAIVQARAALARTAPVKSLRPQALGVKLLAVGATATALNVPAGAWREHMRKFSLGWFVAVHCTIPFVAMLRKAVIMPPAAIAFTIGCAILGQAIGARLERQRLKQERLAIAVVPAAISTALLQPDSNAAAATASRPGRLEVSRVSKVQQGAAAACALLPRDQRAGRCSSESSGWMLDGGGSMLLTA